MKITLFIMDVGVMDQRFSLSEGFQSRVQLSRAVQPGLSQLELAELELALARATLASQASCVPPC